MSAFAERPLEPLRITVSARGVVSPSGPTLVRRMSDMAGLYADSAVWSALVDGDNPVVYTVQSSPVPEVTGELPQSVTTIQPGICGGEFFMTKGHQHVEAQGEIYLGLSGVGGILLSDGQQSRWIDMAPGVVGYIPPMWAHRSVNTGTEPYQFLAVYPGSAGHDYCWVLENGMGLRAYSGKSGVDLRSYSAPRPVAG